MAAIATLVLAFLIVACALHIQLIYFIQKHQEMQEKQHQLAVQHNSHLSSLVQNQQEMQEKLHQLAVQQTSQLSTLLQIHQEMNKQLTNISNFLKTPPLPQDCWSASTTGPYKISPRNKALGSFSVYCDMDITPSGWIVFQRRFDGSVDFDRNWVEYEDGFGSLNGEFWLGLKKLHVLTSHNRWELRVDLEDFEGNHAYALYDNFKVGDSSSLYRLTLGSYSGTAGVSTKDVYSDSANGMAFTTKDKDNDKWSAINCGANRRSGWWHRSCTKANLNGLYLEQDGYNLTGMYWYDWKQTQSLKKSKMKIRPVG